MGFRQWLRGAPRSATPTSLLQALGHASLQELGDRTPQTCFQAPVPCPCPPPWPGLPLPWDRVGDTRAGHLPAAPALGLARRQQGRGRGCSVISSNVSFRSRELGRPRVSLPKCRPQRALAWHCDPQAQRGVGEAGPSSSAQGALGARAQRPPAPPWHGSQEWLGSAGRTSWLWGPEAANKVGHSWTPRGPLRGEEGQQSQTLPLHRGLIALMRAMGPILSRRDAA